MRHTDVAVFSGLSFGDSFRVRVFHSGVWEEEDFMLTNKKDGFLVARPSLDFRATRPLFTFIVIACWPALLQARDLFAEREAAVASAEAQGSLHAAGAEEPEQAWLTSWLVSNISNTPVRDRFDQVVAEESKYFWLPVYWGLGSDPLLRKAIGLSAEQEKKLRNISAESRKDFDRVDKNVLALLNTTDPSEDEGSLSNLKLNQEMLAMANLGQIEAAHTPLAITARGQIEAVLTPSQLAVCQTHSLAAVMASYLHEATGLKELVVTRDQLAKLAQLDMEWQSRKNELRENLGAKCLAVFSGPQQVKLRAAIQRPKQLTALKEAEFLREVVEVRFAPDLVQELALTKQQVADIKAIDREMDDRLWALGQEMNGKLFSALRAEQQKKLQEECARGTLHSLTTSVSGVLLVPMHTWSGDIDLDGPVLERCTISCQRNARAVHCIRTRFRILSSFLARDRISDKGVDKR
jgi:hypothetical protein